MIFGISIITTTGFPYYAKDYVLEPKNIPLKMLFFDYSKKLIQSGEDSQFELMAGLIAAIFNFSNALNNKIGELVYYKPEYEVENLLDGQDSNRETGTLMMVRCESYCLKNAIRNKLDFIYKKIIEPLEPLSDRSRLAPSEKEEIQSLILNMPSKQLIRSHSKELEKYLKDFIKNNKKYGVEAVIIATDDLMPLKAVNITGDEARALFRTLGQIPEVTPLAWKFRQAWTTDNVQVSLVFINSAFNVEFETLQQPLQYIIVCGENAALGELPRQLYLDINDILYK
ncbi:MAG: hypothetical protein ACTSU9_00920 [Promethearchaeota archaeon]